MLLKLKAPIMAKFSNCRLLSTADHDLDDELIPKGH